MTYKYRKCRPNRCFCRGGFPVSGSSCTKYSDHKCSICFGFKKLVNGKCIDLNNEIKKN